MLLLLTACLRLLDADVPATDSPAPAAPDGAADLDGDGHPPPEDCDDVDSSAFPGGTERCDGADNDCDGHADGADATDASTWYFDGDGDGRGDPEVSVVSCEAPSGYVSRAGDCDDEEARSFPGNPEVCDGVDNDCNGRSDEVTAAGTSTFHADSDGDGYGDPATTLEACAPPERYVANAEDCNDARDDVHPGAEERCDGTDNTCDGTIDEGC